MQIHDQDLILSTFQSRGVWRPPVLAGISLLVAALGASAAVTEYENTTTGTFDNNAGSPLIRTINVPTSSTIQDLDVGINLNHTWRGDVRVTLESPIGTRVVIIEYADPGSDSDDNFDVLIDGASGFPLDDDTNNNTAAPRYELDRVAAPTNPLSAFVGEDQQGDWHLEFEDLDIGAPDDRIGTFNRAKLRITEGEPLTVRLFDDRYWNGTYEPTIDTTAVLGVSMTLTDQLGGSVAATDNGDGTYTLDHTGLSGVELLLEVDAGTLPPGYFPGIVRGGSTPLTQVVDVSGVFSLEIPVQVPKTECLVPADFDMFTTCFVGGPRDNRNPVEFRDENGDYQFMIPATSGAVLAFPRPAASSTPSTQNRYLATIEEVGATNGLAVQDTLNRVYAGAFAKRHSDYGPGDSGAIYVIDTGGGGVLDTITIPSTGATLHAIDATNPANNGTTEGWLRDSDFFAAVGKEGLGDVEIDTAQTVLWTINLNDRHLYMVDIADPTAPGYGTVTDLGEISDPGCPGGPDDWRPYALEYHDGELYIGGTSTGQTNQSIAEMDMRVFRVTDPTTPAASVAMTAVYTTRVSAGDGGLAYVRGDATIEWSPWIDAWDINAFGVPPFANFAHVYPQPWLTDIEFDNNHNLILGIRDRFGDQMGINTKSPGAGTAGSGDDPADNALYETVSMGEILHVCWDPLVGTDVTSAVLGDWTLEGQTGPSGVCGPQSDDPNDAVTALEFYAATSYGAIHPETAQGALAFHPGFPDEIATIAQDPFSLRSGGVSFFSTLDGTSAYQNGQGAGGHQVYGGQNTAGQPEQSLFGKANGLGDLEYSCGVTGQQIGNRVWFDEDTDGIQDPVEVPIEGVTVYLYIDLDGDGNYDDSTGDGIPDPITFTTTDSDGRWYFSTHADTSYAVAFDPTTAPPFVDSGGSPVTGDLAPTLANVAGNTLETTDSDARASVNGLPAIALTTPNSGVSGHDFDAGFTNDKLVAIGNMVFVDLDGDGRYEPIDFDYGVDGVTVELFLQGDDPNLADPLMTTTTSDGGLYVFDPLLEGSYFVHIAKANFAPGGKLEDAVSSAGSGSDAAGDDDADEDGIDAADPAATGVSSVVHVLTANGEPVGESGKAGYSGNRGDSSVDQTADFGFVVANASRKVVIGFETDDSGAPMVPGVTDLRVVQPYANVFGPGSGVQFASGDPVNNPLNLYDSEGSTAQDTDLERNSTGSGLWEGGNLTNDKVGNLLILQEDGVPYSTPNDNGAGGDALITSDLPLASFAFDYIDLDAGRPATSFLIIEDSSGPTQVVVPFTDLEEASGSIYSSSGAEFGNRNGNRLLGITAAKLGLVSFDKITFSMSGSGGIGSLCLNPAGVAIGNLVFGDTNGDGDFDPATEAGLPGVGVELYQSGDDPASATPLRSTVTDAVGCYIFDDLNPGSYFVHIPAAEFRSGGDLAGYRSSAGAGGDDGADQDADENGGDVFLPGVYGIRTNDYQLDALLEPTTETAASKACYSGPLPDSSVNLTADLGFLPPYDYGDLPEGGNKDYPTAGPGVGDRPRHLLGSGLVLGSLADAEDGGQSSSGADGDGLDEDGVSIPDLVPGRTAVVSYTASIPVTVSAPVYLNAFIDFNCDGDFDDFLEQVATDVVVSDGANTLNVLVPPGAAPGTTFARFRISTDSGLGAAGDAADGEVEDYLVTVLRVPGAIGNYVWLDENSDGLQDAGEPGIPNVRVVLKDAGGTEIASTFTDAHGGYLFPDLDSAPYFVDVDETTLPPSLSQTTLYTNGAGDFGNKDHSGLGYAITLSLGQVNRSADFGYNHNPTDDVNAPVGGPVAALGNRVWIDVDGDGFQDPEEPGVVGAQLFLVNDPDGDSIFDNVVGSTFTDANGHYLFDDLAPGAYVVFATTAGSDAAGYPQTGDPDHFGTTGSVNDGFTTSPVVLGPGDVFLNADFGYQPPPGARGAIGDRVWLDQPGLGEATQGDKGLPPSEPGIEGVTVALIRDTDKDGVWGPGEPVIATDTTDASGCYLFEGLVVDADGEGYIVWVNDSDGVLVGLTQTYDRSGPLDRLSATVIDDGAGRIDLTQDFSFTLAAPGGSIGDTVWGDLDNSGGDQGTRGLEPGIEGVTVSLCAPGPDGVLGTADDVLLASTLTDSTGGYFFGGLGFGNYRVKVDSNTLPVGYAPAPSFDADGGADGYADLAVTPAAPHRSDGDFSYPPDGSGTLLNSIGDKVWADNGSADAAQATDGSEPGIPGVLVTLLDGAGSSVLGTTFTDAKGCYLFTGLADGTYVVRISSPAGYAASPSYDPFGANDGLSRTTVSGGQHDRAQDFSYAPTSPLGSIGDTVWFDTDSSGGDQTTQGAEPGIAGVAVYLCDSFGTEIASAVTGPAGDYLFEALPYGDYVVKVDPTTLPEGVSPTNTHDSDGGADSSSVVTIDAGNPDDRAQDFSYPPCGQIGDTVFYDLDCDAAVGFGEGLAGITVQLLDASGTTLLATDYTDPQGRYLFDCVAEGTYTVRVVLGTVENTVDPDTPAPGDGESIISLGAGESDFDQDFGYRAPLAGSGSIGNLVWEDRDANGLRDAGEPGIDGVTVDLYYDINGNCLLDGPDQMLGRTVTSAGGAYLFDRLLTDDGGGDMVYLVDVSDIDGVLGGHWHSLGQQGQAFDDNSKADPYCVTLSTVETDVLTADFGYYVDAGCLGNYVWQDLNDNGVQDDGPGSGIDGALVTLTVTYPDDTQIEVTLMTGSAPNPGAYQFCNLLLDEDYRSGSGTLDTPLPGQPAYGIRVQTVDRFPAQVDAATATDLTDSDAHTGVAALPAQGSTDALQNIDPSLESDPIATYDFGFVDKPGSYPDFQMGYATVLGLDDNDVPGVPGGSGNTGNDQADPDDNPDGDIYDNALEYALCDPPGSGANPKPFCVDLGGSGGGSGTVDAFFTRRAGGLPDVTYTLQVATSLGSTPVSPAPPFPLDPPSWAPWSGPAATVVDNGDGSETVTFADLEQHVGPRGIVRLQVDLSGDPSSPHFTPTFGWDSADYPTGCQTCSYPYATKSVFSGTANPGDYLPGPGTLDADGAAAALAGGEYLLEFIAGPYAGHRFDIDEAATTATEIALDLGSARNTLSPPPALLSGQYAVRPHMTLAELVDPDLAVPTLDPSTGDRTLFFDGSMWTTYWVTDIGGLVPPQWTDVGDGALNDAGGTVVDACAGFFLHPKGGLIPVLRVGVVRDWPFACPLGSGYNLVGSGYPTDTSPFAREMLRDDSGEGDTIPGKNWFTASNDPLLADQVLLWYGDEVAGTEGYTTYFRLYLGGPGIYDYWTDQTNSSLASAEDDLLFEFGRATFYDMTVAHDRGDPAEVWIWPPPWAP